MELESIEEESSEEISAKKSEGGAGQGDGIVDRGVVAGNFHLKVA